MESEVKTPEDLRFLYETPVFFFRPTQTDMSKTIKFLRNQGFFLGFSFRASGGLSFFVLP